MSFSGSVSGGKAKFGGNWLGQLDYFPNAGSTEGKQYPLKRGDFWHGIEALENNGLMNLDAKITKHVILGSDLGMLPAKHHYSLFRTDDGWWWTLEKHDEGLVLQRSESR